MSLKRSVLDADFSGKTVLVRVDFNVPIRDGVVSDDTRIRAALPTIELLAGQGARVVLMSHLGRPSGTGFEPALSTLPAARRLAQLTTHTVRHTRDVCGDEARFAVETLAPGEVLLLENLRFDPREKAGDAGFASELASLADAYVDDAFGVAHRAHASVVGVPRLLPAYAGLLLSGEVDTICGMLRDAARPFVAVLGGSKVSDKIGVIDALLGVCDAVLIGGGMCFTFMAAQGKGIGRSLLEKEWVDRARDMILKARDSGCELMLPTDYVVASAFENDAETRVVSSEDIPDTMMGLDIGPATVAAYSRRIAGARTIFWNGPMGVFEMPSFAAGTRGVGEAIADNASARSIVGGGDSAAAVKQFGLADRMTFISTGGGASMKLVEGARLPGLEAIPDA